jgi:ribosomal protein S18 acetylase RimI-like enzyme
MENVLENPAWSALTSGNANLSYGNHEVKFFDHQVSPFIALRDNTEAQFDTLHTLLPHNNPVGFINTRNDHYIPSNWKVLRIIACLQMVHGNADNEAVDMAGITDLTEQHVPQMLALTKLTQPGPFADKTISFGHYQGIFKDNRLIAMTGQRLHCANYTEISAVCTHPNHTGKGYAARLMLSQIKRMKGAGKTPMLHVRQDNHRAIKVYERLGFATSRELFFYFLQKNS